MNTKKILAGALAALFAGPVFAAGEYFATSFEEPGNEPGPGWNHADEDSLGEPKPLWRLPNSFINNYGTDDKIDVSTASSHTGNRSLIVNYTGDNSTCNTCGSTQFRHIAADEHQGVKYFIARDEGAVWKNNMATLENPNRPGTKDGPRAEPGKYVYNQDNGNSKWIITRVLNEYAINDRLTLRLVSKGTGHTSDDEAMFNSGDRVNIAKRCGVDGTIGLIGSDYDRSRRTDCNQLISWFIGTQPNDGTTNPRSIYTRYYLKLELSSSPNEDPKLHQKLHYFRTDLDRQGLDGTTCDSSTGLHTVVDTPASLDGIQFTVFNMNKYNDNYRRLYRPGLSDALGNMIPAEAVFERNVWYYIEEEFRAATLSHMDANDCPVYNNDGLYRLWFARADDAVASISQASPSFELTDLAFPPIRGGSGTHVSFFGNIQHSNHTIGKWYIDDVSIGSTWSGPIAANSTVDNLPPPNAPSAQ